MLYIIIYIYIYILDFGKEGAVAVPVPRGLVQVDPLLGRFLS